MERENDGAMERWSARTTERWSERTTERWSERTTERRSEKKGRLSAKTTLCSSTVRVASGHALTPSAPHRRCSHPLGVPFLAAPRTRAMAFDLHSELLRLHEEGEAFYVRNEVPVADLTAADARARLTRTWALGPGLRRPRGAHARKR